MSVPALAPYISTQHKPSNRGQQAPVTGNRVCAPANVNERLSFAPPQTLRGLIVCALANKRVCALANVNGLFWGLA